jgi:hypothetical protein
MAGGYREWDSGDRVETAVLDWRARLVCSECGCREIDMVVTGERR